MVHDQLLDLLVQHSYQFSPDAEFKLASGRMSQFYVNCKTATMRRAAALPIAQLFEPHIPRSAQAVGGLTMGADPIAYAIRDFGKLELDAFVVRKAPKEHGLKKLIEGPVSRGMKVVVVDDVVTTGGSTIMAIEECTRQGLEVVAVIVLVDRQEDAGLERIRAAAHCPVEAIFTVSELHDQWLKSGRGADHTTARSAAAAI